MSMGVFLFHTAKKILFMYSFSGNYATSVPISTFMLWAINIFARSAHIFPAAELAGRWWEYINCSQTHECGNWDCGRAIPFLGIFVSNFRYWFFAVQCRVSCPINLKLSFVWNNPFTQNIPALHFEKLYIRKNYYQVQVFESERFFPDCIFEWNWHCMLAGTWGGTHERAISNTGR